MARQASLSSLQARPICGVLLLSAGCLLSLLALSSCSGGGGGGGQDEVVPFILTDSYPSDGQMQVPTLWPLYLYFSKSLDPATVDDTSITLTDLTLSQPVPLQFSLQVPDSVEISVSLQEATDYRLDIADTVSDYSGATLEAALSITFRTVDVKRLVSPDPQACYRWGGGVFCGDIDGDGYDDAAVKQLGLVTVFFGPDLNRQAWASGEFTGIRSQEMSGADVDGDGYQDLAVTNRDPSTNEYYVRVLFGPDLVRSSVLADPIAIPPALGLFLAMGDVNGDSFGDLVSGTGLWDVIVVMYGPDFTQYTTIPRPFEIASSSTEYGTSLSVGDLDGDGMDEVVVGAPHAAVDGTNGAGAAFVFWAPSLSAYSMIADPMPLPGSRFGSVLEIADVGGDSVNDLIVPVEHDVKPDYSYDLLIWEGPALTNMIRVVTPADPWGGAFGQVAVADTNGDLAADIVVGWPAQGWTIVMLGPTFEVFNSLFDPDGSLPYHWFGNALVSGDVNNDGLSDILVGEPAICGSSAQVEGRAFVFFGP